MTMPLTRETLAELRRLREAEVQAFRAWIRARPSEDAAEAAALRSAINHSQKTFHRHIDSLLDAAERGLDVGDGR